MNGQLVHIFLRPRSIWIIHSEFALKYFFLGDIFFQVNVETPWTIWNKSIKDSGQYAGFRLLQILVIFLKYKSSPVCHSANLINADGKHLGAETLENDISLLVEKIF